MKILKPVKEIPPLEKVGGRPRNTKYDNILQKAEALSKSSSLPISCNDSYEGQTISNALRNRIKIDRLPLSVARRSNTVYITKTK